MIDESDLQWDGEVLATPRPAPPAGSETLTIEGVPFNPAFLTLTNELELSVRTANCLKNDNLVYKDGHKLRAEGLMRSCINVFGL